MESATKVCSALDHASISQARRYSQGSPVSSITDSITITNQEACLYHEPYNLLVIGGLGQSVPLYALDADGKQAQATSLLMWIVPLDMEEPPLLALSVASDGTGIRASCVGVCPGLSTLRRSQSTCR